MWKFINSASKQATAVLKFVRNKPVRITSPRPPALVARDYKDIQEWLDELKSDYKVSLEVIQEMLREKPVDGNPVPDDGKSEREVSGVKNNANIQSGNTEDGDMKNGNIQDNNIQGDNSNDGEFPLKSDSESTCDPALATPFRLREIMLRQIPPRRYKYQIVFQHPSIPISPKFKGLTHLFSENRQGEIRMDDPENDIIVIPKEMEATILIPEDIRPGVPAEFTVIPNRENIQECISQNPGADFESEITEVKSRDEREAEPEIEPLSIPVTVDIQDSSPHSFPVIQFSTPPTTPPRTLGPFKVPSKQFPKELDLIHPTIFNPNEILHSLRDPPLTHPASINALSKWIRHEIAEQTNSSTSSTIKLPNIEDSASSSSLMEFPVDWSNFPGRTKPRTLIVQDTFHRPVVGRVLKQKQKWNIIKRKAIEAKVSKDHLIPKERKTNKGKQEKKKEKHIPKPCTMSSEQFSEKLHKVSLARDLLAEKISKDPKRYSKTTWGHPELDDATAKLQSEAGRFIRQLPRSRGCCSEEFHKEPSRVYETKHHNDDRVKFGETITPKMTEGLIEKARRLRRLLYLSHKERKLRSNITKKFNPYWGTEVVETLSCTDEDVEVQFEATEFVKNEATRLRIALRNERIKRYNRIEEEARNQAKEIKRAKIKRKKERIQEALEKKMREQEMIRWQREIQLEMLLLPSLLEPKLRISRRTHLRGVIHNMGRTLKENHRIKLKFTHRD